MAGPSALRALAERIGILPEYLADDGRERRRTSDATRVALLAAMGIEASTEGGARRALDGLVEEEQGRLLDPCRVLSEGEPVLSRLRLAGARTGRVELEIVEEGGASHHREGRAPRGDGGGFSGPSFPLLPTGVHRLRAVVHGAGAREGTQTLIVAPGRAVTPEERIGADRLFGLWANLYSVRSERGAGVGSLSDLAALARFAGEVGAAFVGVNPLHALRNRPPEVSPYGPVSRIFRNPLYIDAEAVPELESSREAQRLLSSDETRRELDLLRRADRLDYGRILSFQRPVLRALHREFVALHRGRDTGRGRAYAEFLRRQGGLLRNFATFLVLEEHLVAAGHPRDWRRWPARFGDRRSEALIEFQGAHEEEIDFEAWLQFELDRQLQGAADVARRAGLPIGLYQDLAVGSAPTGFDPWEFGNLFVHEVTLGAPPDVNIPSGQDWGLPPMNPRRLRAEGYRYWILLLRSAFAHAGALRIDHVMGLFRQFWIPTGATPREGAYVRFPARELLAVLALESRRQGALVVGEDLGTVPRGLHSRLARAGVLSSRVLLFERRRGGGFHPSRRYSRRALVSANTHDLPTLAGFWSGRDLELQRRLGAIPDDASLSRAVERRTREKRELLRRLFVEGLLASPEEPSSYSELCAAVHGFLARTPCPLVGVSLDDLTGETEAVNAPGIPWERHRSWTRRMTLPIERILTAPEVRRALGGLSKRAVRRR